MIFLNRAAMLACILLPLSQLQAAPVDVDFAPGDQNPNDVAHADAKAQARAVYTLRVRYVKVDARWGTSIQLPLGPGDTLTPEKLSECMGTLRLLLTTNASRGLAMQSKGEVGVLYITVDFDQSAGPTNTVGVIFHPYYLHISLVQIGNNVLPVPRAATPTIYSGVPQTMLTLQPTLGVTYDRAFGTGIGGGIDTDLLHLGGSAADVGDNHLNFHAQGSKSLEELFYRANTGLSFSRQRVGDFLFSEVLRGVYDGVKEPLGEGQHVRNAGLFGGGVGLKLAPNTRLWLDTGYRRAADTVDENPAAASNHTDSHEQPNRVLLEAIPPYVGGFFRASLWEENGWQLGSGGDYQRLVGRVGYAKEIRIAQNQTIGFEVTAGAGKLWGDPPPSSRFFGGNAPGQFLYSGPASPSLLDMPAGPLIRSFGEREAGFRVPGGVVGGDRFWHVNLNVSLPLPFRGWFCPLIPNEDTDLQGRDGKPLTIKQMLNNQVKTSAPSFIAAALHAKDPSLSPEEATAEAHSIVSEVEPAADYIINDANLYAIKPFVMFDAAGLSGTSSSSDNWFAAGGGVQLTMVTAHFELGYMRTLSGPTFGNRGSVFVRLVFQNLF